MTQTSLLLALLLTLGVACGPSQERACDGCQGADLVDCEETFELCKDVKGCKRRYVTRDYARGLCTQPTRAHACDGCPVAHYQACHDAYDACLAQTECTDEEKQAIRAQYALGACASE